MRGIYKNKLRDCHSCKKGKNVFADVNTEELQIETLKFNMDCKCLKNNSPKSDKGKSVF